MATFTYLNRAYSTNRYVVSASGQRARVILRTGRTCLEYLRSGWHVEAENGIPYLRQGDRQPNSNLIRNPLTRRMIAVNGRVYRNLIAAGWFHAGAGGGLVQPNGYATLTLVGNHREMEAQLATFHAPLPYVYLYRISDGAMVCIRNYPPQLKDVLGARGDLEDEYDRPEDGYERLANGENLFEGYVLVTPVNAFANAQFLAAADFNGLCVRDSLQQLCPSTDWSDVPESCGPTEMETVARHHRCIIRVYTAICLDESMYEWGNVGNRTNRPVYNLFYAFNHCIPIHRAPIEFPNPADPNIPVIWHDTEADILAAMTTISETEPTMPMAVSTKEGPEFLGFSTLTHHHKTKFIGYEHVPLCWSDRGPPRQLFMDSNGGRPNIQTRMIPYLKSIVRPGITFMREVNSPITVHYYDMRRAYASYLECPYYTGFPDPKGILERCPYDPALLDHSSNLEGVVWVETDRKYPSTCFEDCHMWATFPQVRLAIDRKEPFVARMMIVTTRAAGDPYAHVKRVLGESSKKVFNKLIGRQHMSKVVPTAVARSVDELERLQDEGFVPLKTMEHNGRKSWICTNLREAKEKIPEYALMAAYVHQYQKITLFLDIISKVPWSDVVRIWIDGVCLRKPLMTPLPPRWHQEGISRTYTHEVPCSSLHKVSLIGEDALTLHPYDPIYHHKRILIHGPPGSGKTHSINKFWLADGREATLTASTNIAALNMHVNAMTIHKFLALHKSDPSLAWQLMRGKDRLIIDEYTMISQKMIDEVLQLGYPVMLCGDPKQLCHPECPTIEWLYDQGFEGYELTEIKRTCDSKTKQMYEQCRNLDQKAIVKLLQHKYTDAVAYPGPFQRSHYIASTNEVVNATNITYTNTFEGPTVEWGHDTNTDKRRIRARVAVGMLAIGIKSEKEFKNQEIGHITAVLSNGKVRIRSTMTQREVEMHLRNLNPGFAITFHRCQGQTFDFPIHVNTNRLFEPNMLYVAITRVTHHKHLNLVK